MGRRGPVPKPTRLKLLEGNPGKRPIPGNEPVPPPGRPVCPSWLPAEAKAEFERVVPILADMGLLASADQAVLIGYCVSIAELEQATRQLEKDGRVIDVPIVNKSGDIVGHRMRPHPLLTFQRDALGRLKALAPELGLTPAGRPRLTVNKSLVTDKPRVATRPRTALDREGPPPGHKLAVANVR
jgi:P27 family predicted phage terminase small subunit